MIPLKEHYKNIVVKDLKESLNQCVADHDPTDTYGIGGHGKDRLLKPEG